MLDQFEIAGGSVTGYEHVKTGKNNQDAFCWAVSDLAIAAVVTDGCSDSSHSEVGAKIGAKVVAEEIIKEARDYNNSVTALLPDTYPPYPFWNNVRMRVLRKLDNIVNSIGADPKTTLDYFLFTIVGALITPWSGMIFSVGDGITFLNGEIQKLGPFPNNAPPYLGYSLLGKSPDNIRPEWLQFTVHKISDTRYIESILIGSDGLEDLINAAGENIPGKNELVGPISQFWEDDRYFKNPDMIRRKLSLINRTIAKIDWENRNVIREHGVLPDDTTLVVIRRKK